MTTQLNPYLHNPHFPAGSFFLKGSGPNAALLFHGFTATCYEVNRLGKALNQLGYTVDAPLLPGHGTQPADLNRVRWQDWIETAEIAFRKLKPQHQRIIVGGESNGALISLYLAAEHPEIAAALVYAPALMLAFTPWQRMALPLLAPFVPSIAKMDLKGDKTWQGYKVNPLKGTLQHLALEKAVRARLAKITTPLLIVQGRKDHTIDPHGAEVVYQSVCSEMKELVWMEQSGHCVLLDKENQLVTKTTLDFLHRVKAVN